MMERTPRKMMNEVQVWEYLAKRWQKARCVRSEGCASARIVDREDRLGLCGSLLTLFSHGYMTEEMFERLKRRLSDEFGRDRRVGLWWPSTLGGARVRAAACAYLAAVAKLRR